MMAQVTINYAIGMILLGLGSYFGTGMTSLTALIPTFFGIVFLVLGILARNERYRKHVMHAAAALALIAILGTFGGIIHSIQHYVMGAEITRPRAALIQAVMCIVTIAYLGLCVRSFIMARRARKLKEA